MNKYIYFIYSYYHVLIIASHAWPSPVDILLLTINRLQ